MFPSLFPHQATWKVCLCYTFILLTTSHKIKRLIITFIDLSFHYSLQFLVLNVVWLVFLFFMVLIQEISSMKIWFVLSFLIQRVHCKGCGSTHIVLPTTVLPYFLHIILNIQNALNSNTEMNITYKDYLKRRFKFSSLEPFPVFTRFFSTIHSIIKNRIKKTIYFGFFISPTHLR